jgi:hypothetical protein
VSFIYASRRSHAGKPHWVDSYLDRLGSMLRQGEWRDTDVTEMVEVTASRMFDGEDATVNSDAVLDVLVLNADHCSDSLRRGRIRHARHRPQPTQGVAAAHRAHPTTSSSSSPTCDLFSVGRQPQIK